MRRPASPPPPKTGDWRPSEASQPADDDVAAPPTPIEAKAARGAPPLEPAPLPAPKGARRERDAEGLELAAEEEEEAAARGWCEGSSSQVGVRGRCKGECRGEEPERDDAEADDTPMETVRRRDGSVPSPAAPPPLPLSDVAVDVDVDVAAPE